MVTAMNNNNSVGEKILSSRLINNFLPFAFDFHSNSYNSLRQD